MLDLSTLNTTAFLVPDVSFSAADLPDSWAITHTVGGPAAGTYTEVAFGDNARIDPHGDPWPETVLQEAVRQVAVGLYGTAWAFTYRPEQVAGAVHRHGTRRRERVVITDVECWS
jgi:hypothetical protein